jgi:hypothetical protein
MPDHCPGCGLPVTGGRVGCRALYDRLAARALSDPVYARYQICAFDTYCMQHLESYCQSAKSYAAHLTRLCCGLEHAGDPHVYSAIQHWLNGTVNLVKPALLTDLGSLTVAHITNNTSADGFAHQVHAWAENVWEAYTPQHELARTWIESALQSSSTRRRGVEQ